MLQLKELIQIIRESNPQAAIGFYLIHSYGSNYSGNTERSSQKRWLNIATAIKEMRLNYGIDFIIPYGTAVQNLRASHLNDGNDFSTDGTHLADGAWEIMWRPAAIGNQYLHSALAISLATHSARPT